MNKLFVIVTVFCGIFSLSAMENYSEESRAIIEKYSLKDDCDYVVGFNDCYEGNFSVLHRRSNTMNPNARNVKKKFYPGRVLNKIIKENKP